MMKSDGDRVGPVDTVPKSARGTNPPPSSIWSETCSSAVPGSAARAGSPPQTSRSNDKERA